MIKNFAAGIVVAGFMALVLQADTAFAYPHGWNCTAYSGSQCYDYTGTQYNPWVGVYAYVGDFVLPEVCAKAITSQNNIRAGSGCASNSFRKQACFSGGSPITWAYVYWAGAITGTRPIAGRADTVTCPTYA